MGCQTNHRCYKTDCPGSITQARGCSGEDFTRGRNNGEIIYNGDVVMLYVNCMCQYKDDSLGTKQLSVDFCPGRAPPSYLSYEMCSKYAFQVYRRNSAEEHS